MTNLNEWQREILDLYGLKPWHIGLEPVPRTRRIWSRITFGRTRVRIMRWREGRRP